MPPSADDVRALERVLDAVRQQAEQDNAGWRVVDVTGQVSLLFNTVSGTSARHLFRVTLHRDVSPNAPPGVQQRSRVYRLSAAGGLREDLTLRVDGLPGVPHLQ